MKSRFIAGWNEKSYLCSVEVGEKLFLVFEKMK